MVSTKASWMTRQALAQVGQHRVRRHAGDVVVVERGQAREDRAGVGRDGERGGVEPGEGRDMLDARRRQDDLDRLLDHRFGPLEGRARRQLDHGDQIALVLFRNEPGRACGRTARR